MFGLDRFGLGFALYKTYALYRCVGGGRYTIRGSYIYHVLSVSYLRKDRFTIHGRGFSFIYHTGVTGFHGPTTTRVQNNEKYLTLLGRGTRRLNAYNFYGLHGFIYKCFNIGVTHVRQCWGHTLVFVFFFSLDGL